MKHLTFNIPIWDYPVILIVGGNYEDILKIATKNKMSEQVKKEIVFDNIQCDDRGACYWCRSTGTGVLWFPKGKIQSGTIFHEIVHLVDYLSVHIGMETEMEARAYTSEYLIEEIPKLLKKLA